MPLSNLHLTTIEITHSLTSPEIASILTHLGPNMIQSMADHTFIHRTRLIKPMLSYDAAAIALSFVPAAGESLPSRKPSTSATAAAVTSSNRTKEHDAFTYHHLRRSLYNLASSTGVTVDSRYIVPSSHITIGRFLTQTDHDTPEKMSAFLARIEKINEWLREEFWPSSSTDEKETWNGEWIVGQEKGLDCREGALWYGGGRTVRLGKGF